jgi:galactose-1-phosphate uridylyltransferase
MADQSNFQEFLNIQKEQFHKRNRDARFLMKAFGRCLHELSKHTDADLGWVHQELMNEMGAKFQTKVDALDIGGLVALLVCFGSSVEQAKRAAEQLYGISEKTVRDAYNMVLKDFNIKDKSEISSNIEFRSTFVYEASTVTKKLGKPFPEDHPAALEAYKKALEAEKEFALHGPKIFENTSP